MSNAPETITLHLVPKDATIPSGVQYHYILSDGHLSSPLVWHGGDFKPANRNGSLDFYTQEKLESPKPELPDEAGSLIFDVEWEGSVYEFGMRLHYGTSWLLLDRGTGDYHFADSEDIKSFSLEPMAATPAVTGVDLFDEEDLTPRVDTQGDFVVKHGQGWTYIDREASAPSIGVLFSSPQNYNDSFVRLKRFATPAEIAEHGLA